MPENIPNGNLLNDKSFKLMLKAGGSVFSLLLCVVHGCTLSVRTSTTLSCTMEKKPLRDRKMTMSCRYLFI